LEPGEAFPDEELYPGGLVRVYFQPPSKMEFPCIKYERDDSWTAFADNLLYFFKKRYLVTVIDRDPDSALPDLVEHLPYTEFQRHYARDGLNHWAYNLYF
jgi:hypothetical protein